MRMREQGLEEEDKRKVGGSDPRLEGVIDSRKEEG